MTTVSASPTVDVADPATTGPATALRVRNPASASGAPGRPARTITGSSSSRYADPQVLAELAALKSMSIVELKAKWRELNGSEPPSYNRKYLESRLAYRIQELAFGGLRPATRERLKALGDELECGKDGSGKRGGEDRKLLAGTRLIREWQGEEQTVTVLANGYEWQGRPYKSLSAVARAIAGGTRWNGWLFFGLKGGSQRGTR